MILEGKNAVITGANRGLGKAIATEFVKQGANVLICARDVPLLIKTIKELSAYGTDVFACKTDVSNERDLNKLYNTSMSYFDKVDILVNNAGIQGAKGLIEETKWNEWLETINTNLLSVVYLCKLFIPHFKNNKSGKIINISGGGAANPRAYFSAYAVSKVGVVRFTETIAEELKDYNIDCNSVAPGALNTRLLDEVLSAGPDKIGRDAYNKFLKQKEQGGSSMENAAKLCSFLASPSTNGITGKLISAAWDDWKNLTNHKQELKDTDVYTLRRILPEYINPCCMEKI